MPPVGLRVRACLRRERARRPSSSPHYACRVPQRSGMSGTASHPEWVAWPCLGSAKSRRLRGHYDIIYVCTARAHVRVMTMMMHTPHLNPLSSFFASCLFLLLIDNLMIRIRHTTRFECIFFSLFYNVALFCPFYLLSACLPHRAYLQYICIYCKYF